MKNIEISVEKNYESRVVLQAKVKVLHYEEIVLKMIEDSTKFIKVSKAEKEDNIAVEYKKYGGQKSQYYCRNM